MAHFYARNSGQSGKSSPDPAASRLGALNGDHFFSVSLERGRYLIRGDTHIFIGHALSARPGGMAQGAFLEWQWTGTGLLVKNDRYGLCPAYYVQTANGFAIATSVHRLIEEGVSGELDHDALSVFFRLGNFVGGDTPFKAIRALPPGVVFRWTEPADTPKGTEDVPVATVNVERDEACRIYGRLFSESVRRHSDTAPDAAVALSGGMDSRHILLELCRQGRRPKFCVTASFYKGVQSEDVDLAARVAQTLDVPHLLVEQQADWLQMERRKLRETHLCAFEHTWGVTVADFLRGKVGAVYDGLGGDVLSDCRWILTAQRHDMFRRHRFEALAEDFLGTEDGLRYLAPSLRGRLARERAVARLSAELRRHADTPNPTCRFVFWNRTRRAVALLPYGIWNGAVHVLTPFLDHALFDFLSGLPGEQLLDGTFHADTIRREFPAYAEIPFYSGGDHTPGSGTPILKDMTRSVLGYGVKRIPAKYLSNTYVFTRLSRALLDPRQSRSALWLIPVVMYGLELESVGRARHPSW